MSQRISLIFLLIKTVLIQGFLSGRWHVPAYWTSNEKSGVAALRMPEKIVKVLQVLDSDLEDVPQPSNPDLEDAPQVRVPGADISLEQADDSKESKVESYSKTIYVVNLSYGRW